MCKLRTIHILEVMLGLNAAIDIKAYNKNSINAASLPATDFNWNNLPLFSEFQFSDFMSFLVFYILYSQSLMFVLTTFSTHPHRYPMTQTYLHIHIPSPLKTGVPMTYFTLCLFFCSHCSFYPKSPFINLRQVNLTHYLTSKSDFTFSMKPPTSVWIHHCCLHTHQSLCLNSWRCTLNMMFLMLLSLLQDRYWKWATVSCLHNTKSRTLQWLLNECKTAFKKFILARKATISNHINHSFIIAWPFSYRQR